MRHANALFAASRPHSLTGLIGVDGSEFTGPKSLHTGFAGYRSQSARSFAYASAHSGERTCSFTEGHVSRLKNIRGWSRRIFANQASSPACGDADAASASVTARGMAKRTVRLIR